MLVRAALGAACAAALAASAFAPAVAAAQGEGDELRVRVCKDTDSDEEFDFEAWTDSEDREFSLEDGDCRRLRFDFDRNRFWLEELDAEDFDVRFRVRGDDERVRVRDERVRVTFDDEEDEPSLRITVFNEED